MEILASKPLKKLVLNLNLIFSIHICFKLTDPVSSESLKISVIKILYENDVMPAA